MSSKDFKQTFLNSLWKEMERVATTFNTQPKLDEAVKDCRAVLTEAKTNIKDLFR